MDTHICVLVYSGAYVKHHFMSLSCWRAVGDPELTVPNVGITPVWPVRYYYTCQPADGAADAARANPGAAVAERAIPGYYRAWVCMDRAKGRCKQATDNVHEFVCHVSRYLGRHGNRIIFVRFADAAMTQPISIGPGDPLLTRLRKWLTPQLLPWIEQQAAPPRSDDH